MLEKDIDYKIVTDFVFFRDTLQILDLSNKTDIKSFLLSQNKKEEFSNALEIDRFVENYKNSDKRVNFFKQTFYPSLTLNLTNNCNLNCSYCFAFKKDSVNLMDFEHAKASILWLVNTFKSEDYSILFFGGEPLLMESLIEKIVNFCNELSLSRQINIYYSITTNGTIMNDNIIQLFRDNNFRIKISMDGPKEVNDINRKYGNGKGSFEDIYNNLDIIRRYKIPYEVKATVSPNSIELNKIIDFFERNEIHFSFNYVLQPKFKITNDKYSSQILKKIEADHEKLVNYYYSKVMSSHSIYCTNIVSSLLRLFLKTGQKFACNAGIYDFTVNPDGKLYTCPNISNINSSSIGDVFHGIKSNDETFYNVKSADDLEDCQICIYKYLCSGSCMADKYINNENTSKIVHVTCMLQKYYWDAILKLYYKIHKVTPTYFNNLREVNTQRVRSLR